MTAAEAIAYRIECLCKEQGCNISQLTKKSKLPQSTVYNVAKGKVKYSRMDTLDKIASGFGMTLSQFLCFPEMDNCKV